jgi:hypothetical protein
MNNQYWPKDIKKEYGTFSSYAEITFEGNLALHLIEHFGSIAGKRATVNGGYEKSTDPGIELQTPQELVDRCFEIARLFIERLESWGMIKG